MALTVGSASMGDGSMVSQELYDSVWGTVSAVDLAGFQVKDGFVAQEALLVALNGRDTLSETPDGRLSDVHMLTSCWSLQSLMVDVQFIGAVWKDIWT